MTLKCPNCGSERHAILTKKGTTFPAKGEGSGTNVRKVCLMCGFTFRTASGMGIKYTGRP